MRIIIASWLICAACYSPTFKSEIACDPSGSCPSGRTCGTDNRCHGSDDPDASGTPDDADSGSGSGSDSDVDAPIDGPVDAATDAPPVGCTANAQCATPPDLCSRAGTCNLTTHTCSFPPVDCSAITDQCGQGTCQVSTGNCVKTPINVGQACGTGQTCGGFSACSKTTTAVCDPNGTQSRTCTQHTCQAAACTANTFTDTQACTVPVGSCGASVTNCGACDYSGPCDESGQQPCTCSTFNCNGGVCIQSDTSCPQACTRSTDGDACTQCDSHGMQKTCVNGACTNSSDC